MSLAETARYALRHHDSKTVFAEQWHAQLIAIWDLLVAQGKIVPSEWSRALGAELNRRGLTGEPDSDSNYYDAFLTVLEKTLEEKGIATPAEIERRKADWREAYVSTPHGKPVLLKT